MLSKIDEDPSPIESRSPPISVKPQYKRPAYEGKPDVKVDIYQTQSILLHYYLPLYKSELEKKFIILSSQWDQPKGVLL